MTYVFNLISEQAFRISTTSSLDNAAHHLFFRIVLTYDEYSKTLESKKDKEDEPETVKEQLKLLEEVIYDMQQLIRNPTKLIEISEFAKQGVP